MLTAEKIKDLRERLPSVVSPAMGGDNLVILLASFFEDYCDEDDEMDDSGTWKQAALNNADEVLDAIHGHYADAIAAAERRGYERGRKEALDEAAKVASHYEGTGLVSAARRIREVILALKEKTP